MKKLSLYVPGHRIKEFKAFIESNTGQTVEDLNEAELDKLSSLFIYGKEEDKQETNSAPVEVQVKPKTEKEIFDEIVFTKMPGVVWKEVTSIEWTPAITKDTKDLVYAVEVYTNNSLIKRIVMKDKEKSMRFLSHLNKIFLKELSEKNS